jgi:hypothetical protein
MPTPVFAAHITSAGVVEFKRPSLYRQYLKEMAGRDVVVIVREPRDIRSHSQNNYYHGVVVQVLSTEWGATPADVHRDLKREFGIRSTATLETGQFEDYLERIRAWALTDFGIRIPAPDEAI